ncbi:MAG: YihY/virulence factor BrkB family protein [Leptospiraceae bacterium]|nr:YihY/virulence factor BrkB family protein [Leptospiraceae bacterium]
MATTEKQGLIIRTKNFFLDTLSGNFDETVKFRRRLQASIKFVIAAVRKFLDDEVLLRSASISYAIVVSFVPTLVVVMMLGSRFINLDAYFEKASDFARLSGIQINLEPYFNVIREFLKNAGAIGGIGFLVLLFSATSVLRNVEDSINKIWRVNRTRPMVQKIAGFLMVMVFGPVVLALGISYAQWMLGQFASPNLKQVRVIQDSVQILGDKRVVLVQNEKGKPFREKNVLKQVDYASENESLVYEPDKNTFVSPDRSDIYGNAPHATKSVLKNAVFMDYARTANREILITDNGIILTSRDNGGTFFVKRYYTEIEDRVHEVTFQRMQFMTEKQGLIIGGDGLILRTGDGGDTWQPVHQPGVISNLRQIARVKSGVWAVLGEEGVALITEDAGQSFREFSSLKRALRNPKASFTGLAMIEQNGYIVGEAGLLLMTRNGGETWRSFPMAENMFFQDVAVAPDGTAVAVGYEGLIRYSRFLSDGTVQWQEAKSRADVDLHAVRFYPKENRFIIVGDHYQMMTYQIDEKSVDGTKDFKTIQKAPFWRRLISAIGNVLIPFLVIFILFFLLYKVIPYTQVNAKSAAIGATFTSISWVIFLILYKYYVTNFSKGTAALYGTLALIPITLLLLYVSSLIVLFGAEIAFFVQYPQLFRMSKKSTFEERQKRQLWYAMNLLYRLAQSFNTGKQDCTTDKMIKYCNGDQEEFNFIIERLKNRGYVTQTDDQTWLLAMNPDLIQIGTLLEDLDPSDYSIPDYSAKNAFMRSVKGYFDELADKRSKVFRKVSLSELMQAK